MADFRGNYEYVGEGGELTTAQEILIQGLEALGVSGVNEFIQKSSPSSFTNTDLPLTVESDPIWLADKPNYYTKVDSDTRYLFWRRILTTLSPHFAGDSLNMGTGNITTTGVGTFGPGGWGVIGGLSYPLEVYDSGNSFQLSAFIATDGSASFLYNKINPIAVGTATGNNYWDDSGNIRASGSGTFGGASDVVQLTVKAYTGQTVDIVQVIETDQTTVGFNFASQGYFQVSPALITGDIYFFADFVKAIYNANSLLSGGMVTANQGMISGANSLITLVPAAYYSTQGILDSGTNFLQLDDAVLTNNIFVVNRNGGLWSSDTGQFGKPVFAQKMFINGPMFTGSGTFSDDGTGLITGTSTFFSTELSAGSYISLDNGITNYEVIAVYSDISMQLDRNSGASDSIFQRYVSDPSGGYLQLYGDATIQGKITLGGNHLVNFGADVATGNGFDFNNTVAGVDMPVNFIGVTNTGTFTWMNTLNRFEYSDSLLMRDDLKTFYGTDADSWITWTGSTLQIKNDGTVTAGGKISISAATGGIDFSASSALQVNLSDGVFKPTTDNDVDLGDITHRFKSIFGVNETLNGSSTTTLLVENNGVADNTLVVDTTAGTSTLAKVFIGQATSGIGSVSQARLNVGMTADINHAGYNNTMNLVGGQAFHKTVASQYSYLMSVWDSTNAVINTINSNASDDLEFYQYKDGRFFRWYADDGAGTNAEIFRLKNGVAGDSWIIVPIDLYNHVGVIKSGLVTTSANGLSLRNDTAATALVPVQYSPRLRWCGRVWNTNGAGASNTSNWGIDERPVSGDPPSGRLVWAWDLNGGGYTDKMSLTSAGVLGIDHIGEFTAAHDVVFNNHLSILSDSLKEYFGAGKDMSVDYDGTNGNINTSLVAPSDLNVTCGANKTIELQNSVYEDLQFPISSAKVPAANYPDWETFTANTNEYGFGVDDYIDTPAAEVPHQWVEGTAGHPHLHITLKGAQGTGSNKYAKFSIQFALADSTQPTLDDWTEPAALTGELTIPTGSAALQAFYLDMGDLTLTGYKVGTQIKARIKRIASTGGGGTNEYSGNIFITQCGMHLERDTLGSRQETIK